MANKTKTKSEQELIKDQEEKIFQLTKLIHEQEAYVIYHNAEHNQPKLKKIKQLEKEIRDLTQKGKWRADKVESLKKAVEHLDHITDAYTPNVQREKQKEFDNTLNRMEATLGIAPEDSLRPQFQIKEYYKPPTPPSANSPIAHPDKAIPPYEQEPIKRAQADAVKEAEKIIQSSGPLTPPPSNLPSKDITQNPQRGIKKGKQPTDPNAKFQNIKKEDIKNLVEADNPYFAINTIYKNLHPETDNNLGLEQFHDPKQFKKIRNELIRSYHPKFNPQNQEAAKQITQAIRQHYLTITKPLSGDVENIRRSAQAYDQFYQQSFANKTNIPLPKVTASSSPPSPYLPPKPPIAIPPSFPKSKSIKSSVSHKAKGKIKKTVTKKIAGKASKKLVVKAGEWAIGAITGIGAALGIALGIVSFINKHKEVIFAALSYLWIQLAVLLHLILSSWMAIAGAGIGFLFGGAPGALIGGYLGYQAQQWLSSLGKDSSSGTGELLHRGSGKLVYTNTLTRGTIAKTINPATGNTAYVAESGISGILTGATAVPATIVGIPVFTTIGLAALGTIFVTIVIFTSFTVPNSTQAPSAAIIGEDLQCSVSQPNSTRMWTDIQIAAHDACIPVEILAAIMQTESGGYGLTDAQYQNFSTDGWWEHVNVDNQSVNCYDSQYQTDSQGRPTQCGEGYCYDTCTATGLCGSGGNTNTCSTTDASPDNDVCTVTSPGPLPCPPPPAGSTEGQCSNRDVYGIMQFERSTFHGSSCLARDGINTANPDSCTAGYGGTGNRCNAQDSVFAAARYIAGRIGVSCPYDPNNWSLAQLCQAARTYCGSCGTVETSVTEEMYLAHPELYPCYPYYGNTGDPSGACTSTYNGQTEGYCDRVFRQTNCILN